MKDEDCITIMVMGLTGGVIGGGLLGFLLGGPLGIIPGVFIGGGGGAAIGIIVCWSVKKIRDYLGLSSPSPQPINLSPPHYSWATPSISGTLTASPNPAKVGQRCRINFSYNINGNSDNATCVISAQITAEGGVPPNPASPQWNTTNASSQGFAMTLETVWNNPSDGQRVIGSVQGNASKGAQEVPISLQPNQLITVPVVP
jgi:hypothetical protein